MNYGLEINELLIKFKYFTQKFINIERIPPNSDLPPIIITCHYDTVMNCPGAMDNEIYVAIMLECARIMSKYNVRTNVHLLAFTLEEFNASWLKKKFLKFMDYNLYSMP